MTDHTLSLLSSQYIWCKCDT